MTVGEDARRFDELEARIGAAEERLRQLLARMGRLTPEERAAVLPPAEG
jgi:hypothetical protein